MPAHPHHSGDSQTIPLEVVIITNDYEIKGYIHVSRETREDRRITELLNAPDKRFLAVTNAELVLRRQPSSERYYAFLQLHVNTIQMVHPSVQALLCQSPSVGVESGGHQRFHSLRARLAKAGSITNSNLC